MKNRPIFGGEKQEKHCAGIKALHSVVLTHTGSISACGKVASRV